MLCASCCLLGGPPALAQPTVSSWQDSPSWYSGRTWRLLGGFGRSRATGRFLRTRPDPSLSSLWSSKLFFIFVLLSPLFLFSFKCILHFHPYYTTWFFREVDRGPRWCPAPFALAPVDQPWILNLLLYLIIIIIEIPTRQRLSAPFCVL